MGNREIEIKIIGDTTDRQVALSSRRVGLFKKAREFSILCDVEVALIITDKLHEWSSSWLVSQVFPLLHHSIYILFQGLL